MHYRRLGRTEWMVSEVGLTARGLEELAPDEAEAILRSAFEGGVSLVAIDVRDDLPDLEHLVGSVAGSDRSRLTIVSVLSALPPAEAFGPAVEAAGVRLGGDGTLDVIAVPRPLTPGHIEALDELKERGVVRAAGVATSDPALAAEGIEAGWADVLVAPLNLPRRLAMRPAIELAARRDVGVVLAGRVRSGRTLDLAAVAAGPTRSAARALAGWGLSEPGVHSVAAGPRRVEEMRELIEASSATPLPAEQLRELERAASI